MNFGGFLTKYLSQANKSISTCSALASFMYYCVYSPAPEGFVKGKKGWFWSPATFTQMIITTRNRGRQNADQFTNRAHQN